MTTARDIVLPAVLADRLIDSSTPTCWASC